MSCGGAGEPKRRTRRREWGGASERAHPLTRLFKGGATGGWNRSANERAEEGSWVAVGSLGQLRASYGSYGSALLLLPLASSTGALKPSRRS
ncbi:Hypothetical predicted protein [Podarcis lilfordi]|uniref:Uncharacterized protein n=1 Tax=Podarcis lilfordi TaxID=74358 RepID=A0AA35KBL3_9SAUR|nr:Hypothetical predicted protein [Podarcis lilfordi]